MLKIDSELGSSTGWMSLTDRIQRWSSFIQEPVLMSLLIAVLDAFDFQEPKIELLPGSRSELYQLAMAAVSDAKLVSTLGIEAGSNALAETRKALWVALQVVCTKNHFGAGNEARRIFNTRDVEEMLKLGMSGLADAEATSATAAFLKCMGAHPMHAGCQV